MKINLLEETLEILSDLDKSESDVLAVEAGDDYVSWDVFKKCARDYNYDHHMGRVCVDSDIRIIGKGFVLYRDECTNDSSDYVCNDSWWSFQTFPENVTIDPNITEIYFPDEELEEFYARKREKSYDDD